MTPEHLRELYEERAAIKEMDGKIPRAEAERQAREEVYGPSKVEQSDLFQPKGGN